MNDASVPTVTVIVPNYNHAAFLPQRLETIFSQTFTDYEVVLLDDCSSDGSREILSSYTHHPKVSQIVVNDKNGNSPFLQWKKGIGLARGRFIWIAESDDFCEPSFLASMVKPLLDSNTIGISYCRSVFVDRSGIPFDHGFYGASSIEGERYEKSYCADGNDEIRNFLAFRNTIPNASAVVFRRSIVSDLDIRTSFRYAGDWIFWIKLLRKGGVAYNSEPLNYFRCHAGTTRSTLDSEREKQRTVEYLAAIESGDAKLTSQRHAHNRDHCWLLDRYRDPALPMPWWILTRRELQFVSRIKFVSASLNFFGRVENMINRIRPSLHGLKLRISSVKRRVKTLLRG